MKKSFIIIAVSVFLICGNAFALPFGSDGGAELQGVFDNITKSPTAGSSSVDVTTDFIDDSYDSTWALTASGGSVATLIIELASFAENNIFGVYDSSDKSKYVQLMGGSAVAGDQVTLSIKVDGSVYVDNVDSGVNFAGNSFGYFLDSSFYVNGGLFYSNTDLNADGADHMLAYQGTDTDIVQLPGYFPGLWTDNEFILAFEDLTASASDFDFTDFVVMVESVEPVPEPGTMVLLGFGLIGLAAFGRKKGIFQK